MNPSSTKLIAIQCAAAPKPGERMVGWASAAAVMAADAGKDAPLPASIVWMPKGDNEINACTMAGGSWAGMVRCDELGASIVKASYDRAIASGARVWLDRNHDDGEATAWVRGFSWDPAQGIMAAVEWTSLGERMLREKLLYSFSPTFWVDWESGRVAGIVEGHAAGGLVNSPAFGAAMPALIAARLAGAEVNANSAPAGSAGNQTNASPMNRDLMIKILAALAVTVPADSTDAQLTALIAQHVATPPAPNAELAALKAQLAELKKQTANPETAAIVAGLQKQVELLNAAAIAARKKAATEAVQAAVARGAIPADNTALHARYVSLLEADEKNIELLAALPGKATAQSVVVASDASQRGAASDIRVLNASLVDSLKAYATRKSPQERAGIWASSLAPVLRDRSVILGPILAANSLGSLAGNLVAQRSLALLKLTFPALTAFSTDFSDLGAKFNQTVVSRTRGIPTSSSFVAGTGYAQNDKVDTDVSVTINNHKGVTINLTANDLASTDRDLFGEQVEGIHQRMGLDLTGALYALLLNANFSANIVQAVGGFGRPTLNTIAAALDVLGVPQMGRVALLNSTYFSALGNDAAVVSFAAFQRPEFITEHVLPKVAGFEPLNAPNLGNNGENLAGFCGTPDALVLATRVPGDYASALPGANYGATETVTNPDTGISVMLTQFVDHVKAQATYRVSYMYGAAVGQAASGQRILTA